MSVLFFMMYYCDLLTSVCIILNISLLLMTICLFLSSSTTVVLRGEGAADKALALNGSDVGGWRVSVTILPPELDEMSSEMTACEFPLGYASR